MSIKTVIVETFRFHISSDDAWQTNTHYLTEPVEVVKASIDLETEDDTFVMRRKVYSIEKYLGLKAVTPLSKFAVVKPKRGIWWLTVPDVAELIGDIEGVMWRGKQAVKHHHVTLAFNVTKKDKPDLSYWSCGGRTWHAVEVKGLVYNNKCTALVVDLGSNNKHCCNKVAHITLATAEGVPPVYSNDMLAGKDGAYQFLPLEAELEGTLEFFEFKS